MSWLPQRSYCVQFYGNITTTTAFHSQTYVASSTISLVSDVHFFLASPVLNYVGHLVLE